ncbi:MAG: nucleotidyltransferase domain-containing protein [Muribaculaceae bacterium]|nr:nucleotidyltransferase domain-containing protein [Muribaculaceae bacterium]
MTKRKEILAALRQCARRMFPNGEGRAFLFGSRATGDDKDSSDWDVLIVTEDRLHTSDDFSNYAFPYAELGWRFGEQITPIHYTRSEWERESNTAFYQNVINSAILL